VHELLVVLSTQPSRLDGREAVLMALAEQAWDAPYALHLYYDGFPSVPGTTALSQRFVQGGVHVAEEALPDGHSGTARRVLAAKEYPEAAVVAFLDDDIIYPPDYLATGVAALAGQPADVATVSFHGKRWKGPDYGSCEHFSFLEECPKAARVHAPGAGVSFSRAAFVRSVADREDLGDFTYACDLLFGMAAWEQGMASVVVPHRAGWLRDFAVYGDRVCDHQLGFQMAAFKRMVAAGWMGL